MDKDYQEEFKQRINDLKNTNFKFIDTYDPTCTGNTYTIQYDLQIHDPNKLYKWIYGQLNAGKSVHSVIRKDNIQKFIQDNLEEPDTFEDLGIIIGNVKIIE